MNVAVDAARFADLTRRYHRELQVHCYRMLGSFDAAEDHVQEVFLRAWRSRDAFEERASARTWLYRIATNACLDTLRRTTPALQPYPDQLLDERPGPDMMAVGRETISLAFLAAIQLLPPRQRAVLILRDVLSWSASEAAALLGTTVPAVNSALQRARTTLRERWPGGRLEWSSAGEPDPAQRELLARYIAAHERADPEALVDLLREDIRLTIEPGVGEWTGKAAVARALRRDMNTPGRWWMLPTAANRQPAVAAYVRGAGDTAFRSFALIVLRPRAGLLAAVDVFEAPGLFAAFGLPASLGQRSFEDVVPTRAQR
ncbi:sigma-70 family RNA polymerase sigma factor [Microtetraspora sp. AC03309]|uniref:sigma-70 family RNA polymerase sigma factor n=1 Tax=Microtetraspora sp. AC03309 TaxID=2779376 RepID=UPI001E55F736|nr:sigma-70 family RNA polymerase sigma factor [Microtetraspora sp. AC03309]MCC5574826.1 sigma-70 family RNA polymerase sigma factor [Microtetraspora sp. AC03309]